MQIVGQAQDHTPGYSLVLGGIGGDSHSVGLFLLRNYLQASGYHVHFLGIQNTVEEFFQLAPFVNAVLISTLDGHAKHYLKEFRDFLAKYPAPGVRWYLGGNLEIHGDRENTERYFLELGFHKVFTKFRSVNGLDEMIYEDFQKSLIQPKNISLLEPAQSKLQDLKSRHFKNLGENLNGKIDSELFFRERREVLQHWPTGRAAEDLADNAEFLRKKALFSEVLMKAKETGQLILQPRCGVATVEAQLEIFKTLERAGVQVGSYQIDSLTRNNRYREAAEEIRISQGHGKSSLNGFPLINHGVEAIRKIQAQLSIPLQVRHSTRDPRLLAEIAFAGGASSYEGGAICYNLPYYKTYSLEESLQRWAYVDRLTAHYYDQFGLRLNREFFGTLTATLIPPCLAITVCILETLLAAEQGVRNMSLGYAEQGNRIQDIAAIRCMLPLAEKYLQRFGYRHVELTTVFHQYMAAFPSDESLARELIFQSGLTAYLSGATRLMTKTSVEAIRVPSVAENVQTLHWIRGAQEFLPSIHLDETAISEEYQMIEAEVDALMGGVLELGNGVISSGILRAFEKGWLDIPFSPSLFNAGRVVTLRDDQGAVRFHDIGSLPFSQDIRQWHTARLATRKAKAVGQSVFALLEQDIQKVAEGKHGGWPLGGYTALQKAA